MNLEKKNPTVKSADRVLDIFELFAEVMELNLNEISRRLDLPTSSVFKILQNLISRGYLEKDESRKTFRLGYKVFEIGAKYVQNTNLTTEFGQIAQHIVNEINEAVYLSIRNDNKILYIAEKQSTQLVRLVSHLGMQLPLHSTAMGKMILSGLNDKEIADLYPESQLGVLTEQTIDSLENLMAHIKEIRQENIAYSRGEAIQGIQCAAAPIYNSEKKIVAAMSISIPSTRWNEQIWSRMKELVIEGAYKLSLINYYQQS
ncbi:helix-turn-helix domain-containing protein [Paenibacillus sp. LMG 31458]|uniref:Helix-turn-helix domain-containing protein n=1 Tax=Paenibacillus phytorum TaxID=2654977 RepID=A0ABX1XSU0_9BACL|nr:IclR family transcriptional regulator [Paenibacillus phytorum]NOU71598.1 helix-turn-helix domain-containing protein [Paenibacillus phytorum]